MQQQAAEVFCVQARLGQVGLVSLPSDFVPKRINWAKWADNVAVSLRVKKSHTVASPRLWLSPDHADPKDNLAVMSPHSQSGIEQVDLLKVIASIAEDSRLLFIGSWNQNLPSWFKSLQSVFAAKYAAIVHDVLLDQAKWWSLVAERLESRGNFLVIDDLGRISALSALSRGWRSRQSRSTIKSESRITAWFAATMDLHMARSSEGDALRLHRLQVLSPENWCGSPAFNAQLQKITLENKDAPEIWVSSPGVGMALWIAEQHAPLDVCNAKLRIPSANLGWHPLRDLLVFMAEAQEKSVMYLVDSDANLQVLMKERDGTK